MTTTMNHNHVMRWSSTLIIFYSKMSFWRYEHLYTLVNLQHRVRGCVCFWVHVRACVSDGRLRLLDCEVKETLKQISQRSKSYHTVQTTERTKVFFTQYVFSLYRNTFVALGKMTASSSLYYCRHHKETFIHRNSLKFYGKQLVSASKVLRSCISSSSVWQGEQRIMLTTLLTVSLSL